MPDAPGYRDEIVACDKCGREYSCYRYRIVTNGAEEARTLIDRGNDVIYDLVKVCKVCGTVYHWHTKEKTIQYNSKVYQTTFEKLMEHYKPADESAIIKVENLTG